MTHNGAPPLLEGIPWLHGQRRAIPAAVLASRILCTRHNAALSPLDADAGRVFRALHQYQDELLPPAVPGRSNFLLLSGSRFELWLLKLVLGGLSSRSFGKPGEPLVSLGGSARLADLVEVLFRGAAWPPDWGFYAFPRSVDPTAARTGLAMAALTDPSGGLVGLRTDMGVIGLDLAFGKPEPMLAYRPGAIALYRPKQGVERVVAFTWPSEGHVPVVWTRKD